MIYNYPVGGLGNIFFQIASLWTFAKDNDDELCLLNINKVIYDLIHTRRGNLSYIFNRFPNIIGEIHSKIEHPFPYTSIEYKKNYEYIGYFQSEKYFNHRRPEILELFKPDDGFILAINKYQNLFNNISLHVRHGDYYAHPEIHLIQTLEYYKNALSQLPNDLKVLVFSDDLRWCKQNFIGERFVFIDEIDYISVYIMSKMKHHVIANSSFSWWGAWMSEHNDKIVIAPKKWFGTNIPYGDIVPENWIKI
jgi:hypothetical protein